MTDNHIINTAQCVEEYLLHLDEQGRSQRMLVCYHKVLAKLEAATEWLACTDDVMRALFTGHLALETKYRNLCIYHLFFKYTNAGHPGVGDPTVNEWASAYR